MSLGSPDGGGLNCKSAEVRPRGWAAASRGPAESPKIKPGPSRVNAESAHSLLPVNKAINAARLETLLERLFCYQLILAGRGRNIQAAI